MIKLEKINRDEAVRYLGDSGVKMNQAMESLMDQCEEIILSSAKPKYLYKKIDLQNSDLVAGDSVKAHLKGCNEGIIICATLGVDIDKQLRLAQVTDMAKAVVMDSMASVAIEQVCTKLDDIIADEYKEYNLTWRFSPGYGDYPIELQENFLRLLDSQRKIGLCTNENSILTPTKSVTAIVGLSKEPIEKKRKGCASCKLAKNCKFRKAGSRCDF
ncbi:MAG: methionine synthase [Ruminococcus sp.]